MNEYLRARLPRENNFDLIRLAAALQVAVLHSAHHLGVPIPHVLDRTLELIPGVPIFFFVSGLLVTSSLVSSTSVKDYLLRRGRRVFPALWLALLLALAMLVSFGQIGSAELGSKTLWAWLFTQFTVLQDFHPQFFRDFGVGVVNGSLWTIPVEISFYLVLPIIAAVAAATRRPERTFTALMLVGATLSLAALGWQASQDPEALVPKLVKLSLVPHFWYFALGSLAYRVAAPLSELLRGRALYLAAAFAALIVAGPLVSQTATEVMARPLLLFTVFALALGTRPVAPFLLRGWDVSYGLYLVHMLVVNAMVQLGLTGSYFDLLGAVGVSLALAILSWRFVERPILHRAKPPPTLVTTEVRAKAA